MAGGRPDLDHRVVEVLARAQRVGFLGPAPLAGHVEHSLGFARALAAARGAPLGPEDRVADLGPGGGVPGLVLAAGYPRVEFRLIEGSTRRARFLSEAIRALGWQARVVVVPARAEEVGRDGRWRGQHTVVVARQFGPPAVTAECGAPLLEVGGRLVVSEPPGSRGDRWPDQGLAVLGLRREATIGGFTVLVQEAGCPARYPRRVGVPGKRPLF